MFERKSLVKGIAVPAGAARDAIASLILKVWKKSEILEQRQGIICVKQIFCPLKMNTKCRKKLKIEG